ncbi:MAG: allophanate hydrolase, partial [Mesorhizobium sp.]
MNDIRFDIGSLHAAYASGMSVRAVIETVFQRISEADDPGIFIHLASKAELLAEAEALGGFDPVTKPLWGVPFAVKDNID